MNYYKEIMTENRIFVITDDHTANRDFPCPTMFYASNGKLATYSPAIGESYHLHGKNSRFCIDRPALSRQRNSDDGFSVAQ